MRGELVGIISEGAEDFGILKNIFRAFGFDGSEIIAIRPALSKDATDRHNDTQTIGTFQGVKNACIGANEKHPDFEKFFIQTSAKYIVVQIDTAEIDRHDFPFIRPSKENNPNYSSELRTSAIELINNWLSNNYSEQLFYAVSIEELEAWCLTLFETGDTTYSVNVKSKLNSHLQRKNMTYRDLKCNPSTGKSLYFEKFTSKYKFHKLTNLKKYATKNQSLNDFITSIEEKLRNEG